MIRKISIIHCCLFLSISSPICIQSSASAEDGKGIESHLSIGIGWEQLSYKEHDPDTNSDSSATVYNGFVGFEGLKRWEYVLCGLKGVIPVSLGDDKEEWTVSGILYQTNALQYGWTRIDGYIGYPLMYWLNPYLGLRWSESKQHRTNFLVLGRPAAHRATETVRARYLLLGVRGTAKFAPTWGLKYLIEYFVPIDAKVTNNALPGWEAADKGGYSLELRGGIEYVCTRSLSFCLILYGGRMDWKGSDWEPYAGGLAKWPENDTRYFGGMLNISWEF